jgi:uncharacterized protein
MMNQAHVYNWHENYVGYPNEALKQRFLSDVLHNQNNALILQRMPQLPLPQLALVAGCLYQTAWNLMSGNAPDHAIKDYDFFYFDSSDLSAATEAQAQREAERLFNDLPITIEVKNQARVHTWYEDYFGYPYEALTSTADGISKFLVECTCVGISLNAVGAQLLHAPYGLDDLYAGILRPNALMNHRDLFNAKAASYHSRWSWLTISVA